MIAVASPRDGLLRSLPTPLKGLIPPPVSRANTLMLLGHGSHAAARSCSVTGQMERPPSVKKRCRDF